MKTYTITVDIMDNTSQDVHSLPVYNQGDINTSVLNLNITQNDVAYDLTGSTVSVFFIKSDGTVVYQDSTNGLSVTNAINGNVSVSLNTQTLAALGRVIGAVKIQNGSSTLETGGFYFVVKKSLTSEQALASDNEVSPILGTATLTTTDKSIKGAINEVNANKADKTTVGDLTTLTTTDKDTLVHAINDNVTTVSTKADKTALGDITTLTTQNKTNVVAAINENVSSLADITTKQGDITQLNTTDRTSVVNAIKEIKTQANNNASSIATNANTIANIGNGSPKGTYSSLSALQTAFPSGTSGIYIVTADGGWYYWNGSAWTKGGTYQSTGIADGSITGKQINMGPVNVLSSTDLSAGHLILDKYVTSSGESSYPNQTTGGHTDYIAVTPGQTYEYFAYTNAAVNLGCYYDANKNYLGLLTAPATSNTPVDMTMPANAAYIRVNYAYSSQSQFYVKQLLIQTYTPQWLQLGASNIPDHLIQINHLSQSLQWSPDYLQLQSLPYLSGNLVTTTFAGQYVTTTGTVANYASQSTGGVTDFIAVTPGQNYRYFCYSNGNTNGCIYDANKNFIATLTAPATGGNYAEMVMPANAAYLRLNYSSAYSSSINVYEWLYHTYNIGWLDVSEDNLDTNLKSKVNNPVVADKSVTSTKLSDDLMYKINNPVSVGTAPQTRWYGKTVNFLGDSITYGSFLSDNVNQRFSSLSASSLGFTANNYGSPGTLIARQTGSTGAFVDRYSQMATPADLIVVFGGTNDYYNGTGLLGDPTSTDPTTFNGALNTLITGLQNIYPSSDLLFLTPFSQNNSTRNSDLPNPNSNANLKSYRDAIIDRCNFHGVPVLDLYAVGGMDIAHNDNHKTTYSIDGTHPNTVGHQRIANRLVGMLTAI